MSNQRSGGYVVIPARALDDNRLGKAAIIVLCGLSTYADRDRVCWPRVATLAQRLGVEVRSVQRQLAALERFGYIEKQCRYRTDGGQAANRYRVKFDADLAPEHNRLQPETNSTAEGGDADRHPVDEADPAASPGGDAQRRGGVTPTVTPKIERSLSLESESMNGEKGTETKEQEGARESRLVVPHGDNPVSLDAFSHFWAMYPKGRKGSPAACEKKFRTAVGKTKRRDPAPILAGLERYAAACAECARADGTPTYKFVAGPMVWLNKRMWESEDQPQVDKNQERLNDPARFNNVV